MGTELSGIQACSPAPAAPFPRIVLCTLNARYIHASLGLRYLLANLDRHGRAGLQALCALKEYTISRPAEEVAADLLATLGPPVAGAPPVLGFGVYIWNVLQTTDVLRVLKVARPDLKIVLGGPEVSHETAEQAICALADHVITGWGDVSFAQLCRDLIDGPRPLMKVIPGVQPPLNELALPYAHFSAHDLAHRVLYVEASRGCPFKCEFCLSALDKTAWAFELDTVLHALESLYQRGARQFKFVDRTFNLKVETSARILQFFLDKLAHAGSTQEALEPLALHFEVIPDHLPERLQSLLAQFPPGVLQLEIGIQTFNPEVQHTISRRQNNETSEANLRWLLAHTHAHLHVDLIAGLPGEDLPSFAAGFDRLWAIAPHEIQLGVLKRLRGTPIARHTQSHGMVYQSTPPYTVLQTAQMDAATLTHVVHLARYWDLLANSGRFKHTLPLVLCLPKRSSAFWNFWDLTQFLWQRQPSTYGLTPEYLVEALMDYLAATPLDIGEVQDRLLADYQASGARNPPAFLRHRLAGRAAQPAVHTDARFARQSRHVQP
jgi:hypothetical protein